MLWCFFPVLQASANIVADLESYDRDIRGILRKYCVDCHGPDKQKGDMRLDKIDPDVVRGTSFDQWEDVRESFNSGEMPPEDKPQPTDAERDLLTRWMDAEFKKVKLHGSTKKRGDFFRPACSIPLRPGTKGPAKSLPMSAEPP